MTNLPQIILEVILQLNFWWRTKYQCLYFDIVISRACNLYMKGLRYFMDIWDPGLYDFLNMETTRVKVSLEEVYQDLLLKIIEFYIPFYDGMLNQQNV